LSGVLQAMGNAMNAQLNTSLVNLCLAASVSFLPVAFLLIISVVCRQPDLSFDLIGVEQSAAPARLAGNGPFAIDTQLLGGYAAPATLPARTTERLMHR
jgi:hypothetical protein